MFLYVNHSALEKQIDDILPIYQKWGVAGLKFGFVHVGSHKWTIMGPRGCPESGAV